MQASLIKQVEKHFHEAFLQAKTQFDKKVAIREFPIGCKVFVYTTQRGQISKKLHKPYKGPFVCIGYSQNNNLILRQPNSSKLLHVHKNSCKLGYWRHTNIQLWDPSPPAPDSTPAANPEELYPFLDDDDLPFPWPAAPPPVPAGPAAVPMGPAGVPPAAPAGPAAAPMGPAAAPMGPAPAAAPIPDNLPPLADYEDTSSDDNNSNTTHNNTPQFPPAHFNPETPAPDTPLANPLISSGEDSSQEELPVSGNPYNPEETGKPPLPPKKVTLQPPKIIIPSSPDSPVLDLTDRNPNNSHPPKDKSTARPQKETGTKPKLPPKQASHPGYAPKHVPEKRKRQPQGPNTTFPEPSPSKPRTTGNTSPAVTRTLAKEKDITIPEPPYLGASIEYQLRKNLRKVRDKLKEKEQADEEQSGNLSD